MSDWAVGFFPPFIASRWIPIVVELKRISLSLYSQKPGETLPESKYLTTWGQGQARPTQMDLPRIGTQLLAISAPGGYMFPGNMANAPKDVLLTRSNMEQSDSICWLLWRPSQKSPLLSRNTFTRWHRTGGLALKTNSLLSCHVKQISAEISLLSVRYRTSSWHILERGKGLTQFVVLRQPTLQDTGVSPKSSRGSMGSRSWLSMSWPRTVRIHFILAINSPSHLFRDSKWTNLDRASEWRLSEGF